MSTQKRACKRLALNTCFPSGDLPVDQPRSAPLLLLELRELVLLMAAIAAALSSFSLYSLALRPASLNIYSTSALASSWGLSSHLTLFALLGLDLPDTSVFC